MDTMQTCITCSSVTRGAEATGRAQVAGETVATEDPMDLGLPKLEPFLSKPKLYHLCSLPTKHPIYDLQNLNIINRFGANRLEKD